MDELDDGGIKDGLVAGISAKPGGHEEDGRPYALPSAVLDVAPHFGNEGDARLNVANEFLFDALEIAADRLENLRQVHGHGGILGGVAQGIDALVA
jgi:hypothetical protein